MDAPLPCGLSLITWLCLFNSARSFLCDPSSTSRKPLTDFTTMGKARVILSILALAVIGAGIAMQFFVILSGTSAGGPPKYVYMLQANTDNIPVSSNRNPVRWTFWGMCGSDGSPRNVNCDKPGAAPPFNPPQNFATAEGVPFQFTETSRFYNLSKSMWGMYLVALIFSVLSLATGIPALFRWTGGFKSGFAAMMAFLFQGLAAGLMSAWAVEGRDVFIKSGHAANVGYYAFGFAWGSVGCFLTAVVLYVLGGVVTAEGPARERRERKERAMRKAGGIPAEHQMQPGKEI
ncbi:hypothetical protein K461DRAFT_281449 [Myriangium duriaei CBS 260.36]|uniref:Uncharacterized protein n=1 Tax=Myriangium duriaei CBS 260.36 TaxID=1168546 RepID=A0A9P4IYL5_9PEZI|nr:hypothetical protein K461DRAFT_281449 [Myriangium duriaei CBS 260.36]